MKKNIYAIIDTETSGFTDVYDLGIIIFDKKDNVLFERNYLNMDIFGNEKMMENAYYGYKMPLYKENKTLFHCDTRSMMYDFLIAMKNYNVTHLLAYNLSFDLKALDSTYIKYCNRHFDYNKYKLVDIWRIAIETKINTKKYKDFCKDNDFFTPKGYYSSNAENVYKYVTGNMGFIENHTALSDCYCEKEIFLNCLKQKKGISIGLKGNLWKIIQDKE